MFNPVQKQIFLSELNPFSLLSKQHLKRIIKTKATCRCSLSSPAYTSGIHLDETCFWVPTCAISWIPWGGFVWRSCYTSRRNKEIHIFISIIGSGVQIRSVWGTPSGSWHAKSAAVIGVIYALIQSAWPQGYPFKSPLKPPSSLLCLRMPQLLLLFFLLPTLLFFRMICLATNPLGN